jgi:tetratricopeptide (TPR) repeat protein
VAIGAAEGSERRAHRAYQEGRYDAALGEFEAATEARPAAAELSYGAGLAAYELGDLAHAGGRFAAAAQATSSPEVASASYLALGNTAVRTAQEQQQTDPAAAVSALGGAIESYQRALDLQPGYRDAGHNLEIARLLLEELRNQQERDSQSGAGNDAPGDQGAPDTDAAAEPAGEDGGPEEEPTASQQQQEPGPQPAPPAGEPLDADATAAAIIAQEAANAARRQLLQLEQLQPVEQDW